jgi:hypothetical protein
MVGVGMSLETRGLTGAGFLDESNIGSKKNPMKVN